MRVRKEVSSLNHEELSRLRAAIHCMYQYDDYWLDDRSFGYWGRIHANSCQHGWEQFLPWHRLYLYHFEQQLQDYDPHITLPYWEWSLYADLNRQTYETTILDQGFIPEAFRCWIDADGVACLKDKKQANGQPLFSDEEISGLSRSKFQVLRENSG
ncbi:tyrosinase family protein [Chloroflexi bacterium TSY]|nr:tyrosinase family protein [Chloroflexi bacterium TSY]